MDGPVVVIIGAHFRPPGSRRQSARSDEAAKIIVVTDVGTDKDGVCAESAEFSRFRARTIRSPSNAIRRGWW
jgi:hypothetical protein